MQLAITAALRGHSVELWERSDWLGGQVQLATKLPGQQDFSAFIDWQQQRMQALGVSVKFRTNATADMVVAAGAQVVACATGAEPRRPAEIEGVDASGVFTMAEVLDTAFRSDNAWPSSSRTITSPHSPSPTSWPDRNET